MAHGSEVIVLANQRDHAEQLIRVELDRIGLPHIEVNIDDFDTKEVDVGSVVHSWDGDY